MGFWDDIQRESSFSTASGRDLPYVVLQVTLKEKFWGTGSGNLHGKDGSTAYTNDGKFYSIKPFPAVKLKGFGGGDRIQATLIFEHL